MTKKPEGNILKTVISNGLLPTLLLITFYSAMIWFKLDDLSERTTSLELIVTPMNDTVKRHTYVLFDRDTPQRDTVRDTLWLYAVLPEPPKVRRSPYGSSVTDEEPE